MNTADRRFTTNSGEVRFALRRENLMVKKFIVAVIVCLGFCMVSCGQREEKEIKSIRITEKLWGNTFEMGRELINGDNISRILDEYVIEEKGEERNSATPQLSVKEVRIELGSEVPEEIEEYVSIEDKYREEFEQNACFDLSRIDVHTVGEYRAIVAYEGKETVIPVIVEDTTPPEIYLKNTDFKDGDQVYDSELVYASDESDIDISVVVDGSYRGKFVVYPGMMLTVEATDAYGNRAVKEVFPSIREKEEEGTADGSRVINIGMWGYPVEEMCYANEETYLALKEAYGQIEWKSEFKTGDLHVYGIYREKFRELIEDKKPFYNEKTGEWMYLGEFKKGKGRDLQSSHFYFFDMDSDEIPELGIGDYTELSFFKYDEKMDRFILWANIVPYYYQINGSSTLSSYWSTASHSSYDFCKLDKNGNTIYDVWFLNCYYYDKEIDDFGDVYLVTFPEYTDRENEITEEIKRQGYNYYETYIFRVTEEQYHELTREYFEACQTAENERMDIFYRYEQLWGSSTGR